MNYPARDIPLDADIKNKRAIGNHFEIEFCKMFGAAGYYWSRNSGLRDHGNAEPQVIYKGIGDHVDVLPDVTLYHPKYEFHDLRHKQPLRIGGWGYESARFKFLCNLKKIVKAPVFVTFHDWTRNGRFEDLRNDPADWVCAEVDALKSNVDWKRAVPSINNRQHTAAECIFWSEQLFGPLIDVYPELVGYGKGR